MKFNTRWIGIALTLGASLAGYRAMAFLSQSDLQQIAPRQNLVNANFQNSYPSWTVSSGSFAIDTVNFLDGYSSGKMTASSQQSEISQDVTPSYQYSGVVMQASCWTKTTLSNLEVCYRLAGSDTSCTAAASDGKWHPYALSFSGPSSGSMGVSVKMTSSSSGSFNIADCYLGPDPANFPGNAYFGGDVGIGTTNPANPLSVVGIIQSTTGGFKFPDNSVQTTASTGGSVTSVSVSTANGFAGTVANSTTTPAITMSTTINSPILAGNGTAISAATTTGSGSTAVLNSSPTITTPTFTTSATDPLLIGGTTSSSTLNLESTSGTGSTDYISFLTGSQSEAMRITSAGKLGIGTTNPGATLEVSGNALIDGDATAGGSSSSITGIGKILNGASSKSVAASNGSTTTYALEAHNGLFMIGDNNSGHTVLCFLYGNLNISVVAGSTSFYSTSAPSSGDGYIHLTLSGTTLTVTNETGSALAMYAAMQQLF